MPELRLILRRGLIPGVALLLAGCNPSDDTSSQSAPPPSVTVAAAVSKEVRQSARFVGRVQAVDDVNLIARVSGFLASKNVEDGATVDSGQLLFTIERAPYEATLASAKADAARAQADAALKAADLERDKDLFDKGHVSQAALDQAGELLSSGDFQNAAALYSRILQHDPESLAAIAGLLRALIGAGQAEEARALLADLPEEVAKSAEVESARQALDLAEEAAAAAGELAQLQALLERNPADHDSRFKLAMAYYATGDKEAAAGALLEIIRRNRSWNEDAARTQLLKFFEAWGPKDEVTLSSRRALSSILFS